MYKRQVLDDVKDNAAVDIALKQLNALTQQQIDRMAQLGRRIVSRMEQLGMTPVLQGYVGLSLIHISPDCT